MDLCHVRDIMDYKKKKTIISVKDVGNLLNSSFPALCDRIILRFPARLLMRTRSSKTAKYT